MKRHFVAEKYAAEIDQMYPAAETSENGQPWQRNCKYTYTKFCTSFMSPLSPFIVRLFCLPGFAELNFNILHKDKLQIWPTGISWCQMVQAMTNSRSFCSYSGVWNEHKRWRRKNYKYHVWVWLHLTWQPNCALVIGWLPIGRFVEVPYMKILRQYMVCSTQHGAYIQYLLVTLGQLQTSSETTPDAR